MPQAAQFLGQAALTVRISNRQSKPTLVMALEDILESADTVTLSSVEMSYRPYQKHTVGWKRSDTRSTLWSSSGLAVCMAADRQGLQREGKAWFVGWSESVLEW